jgi:carboxyl-terminal processing protease
MKTKLIVSVGTAIAFLIILSSCEEFMVGEFPDNKPTENFQLMWDKFDSHYGLFLVKKIDWDSIYAVHWPQAQKANSDEELFPVLTSMLSNLNDKHVNIYTTNKTLADYNSGFNGHLSANEDFLFEVVQDNYLIEHHHLAEDIDYGKLGSDLGYIYMGAFKENLGNFEQYMDKIINALVDTEGIVFDIRNHSGGSDHVSKYIAGRFATSKKLFMTSKKRNGPEHNDFESEMHWYVQAEGKKQYTKPVVLLTDEFTISAGETFTFAMRENINVTHMGDTTAGAFSDEVFFELLNGWVYSVSVGDYRGSDGKSYEGIGIAPDVYSRNEKNDVLNGVDATLEKAIKFLIQQ